MRRDGGEEEMEEGKRGKGGRDGGEEGMEGRERRRGGRDGEKEEMKPAIATAFLT